MAIIKHDIPILEHDTNPQAIIMANRNEPYSFPKKAIMLFLREAIDQYLNDREWKIIGEFESMTKIYPIYQILYKGEEVCLCQAPVGAAAAVQVMEFLIGYGVKEIIATGSCGDLMGYPEDELLIPIEALRDEGSSYHYIAPARTIKLNDRAVKAIEKAMKEHHIKYETCKTWSTDGFFRETADMVAYRKEEGCTVVEMECSALAACAQFREVIFGEILFTADTLVKAEGYDERAFGSSSHNIAILLALEAVYQIGY